MKKPMRKILALFLSLMLVLPGTLVFAEESGASDTGLSPMTLEGGISVDSEVVESVAATFGMDDEETLAQIEAVVGLLNALAIKLTTAENGAQLDLELNGESAVSMAAALTESGAAIVSTLFPNYLITASAETILSFISQNVPMLGQMMGSSEGGEDGAAPEMSEKMSGYMEEIMNSCMQNVVPGEPETGEYTLDKYLFNTALPLEIDAMAITETVKDVLSRMLKDEEVVELLKNASGNGFTMDFDPEEISASLDEIFAEEHIPEVSSVMYMDVDEKGESSDEFYVVTEATYKGDEEASYIANVYGSSNGGNVELEMPAEGMSISGSYMVDESGILFLSLYADYQGMFFGTEISLDIKDTFSGECYLYIMDRENPAISLNCYLSQEGELTLSADPEGKTEVSLDDLMNDESGEAASGLVDDVMSNGFGNLMDVILTEVPEAAPLFGVE